MPKFSLTFPELQSYGSGVVRAAAQVPYHERLALYRRAIDNLLEMVKTQTIPQAVVTNNQEMVLVDQIVRIRNAWNDDVTKRHG